MHNISLEITLKTAILLKVIGKSTFYQRKLFTSPAHYRYMDKYIDRQMDGWMDGWMNRDR